MPPFSIPPKYEQELQISNEVIFDNIENASSDLQELTHIAEIVDIMDNEEMEFSDKEKIEGTYYLGTYEYRPSETDHLLLFMTLSPTTFFKYQHPYINAYLCDKPLRILKFYKNTTQVTMEDGRVLQYMEHCVVDKTHWMRAFQRQCRRVVQRVQKN